MAVFHFLDDGFVGRIGTLVGSTNHGKLYVKRFHAPSNPNKPAQQEVRALFRMLNKIGLQLKPWLALINRPPVPEWKLVNHLIHINKAMFQKTSRVQRADGAWTRWHPELFKLCEGTLAPVKIKRAKWDLEDELKIELDWDVPAGVDGSWKILAVVYDEDSEMIAARAGGQEISAGSTNVYIENFANISSFKNCHAYIVYLNGEIGEKGVNPAQVGTLASNTAYFKIPAYTPPPPAKDDSKSVPAAPAQ